MLSRRETANTKAPQMEPADDDAREPSGAVELRLAIGKDGLGIELAQPAKLACFEVVELVVRLPHVKFPFDVSGGIARFRHKRGELERISIEIDSRRFARWAEPRLRGLITTGACTVRVEPRGFGATFTVVASSRSISKAREAPVAALAFELALVPTQDDLVIAVFGARGAHLAEPATALAIRALETLLGDVARRDGARFVVSEAAGHLARNLLPDAGVRAPAAHSVHLAGSGESDGVLFVAFAKDATPLKIPDEAALAAEITLLTRDADEARVTRALERARDLDLAALERAPRHPEIARRIAEIDGVVGGRAEAASATLREAASPMHLGLLAGDLLAEIGDTTGAIAALLRAAECDPSPMISALAYARAAELAPDPDDALGFLDAAVGRAPRLAELRWERARKRLLAGRLAEAKADFQELEAMAHGARDRHDVLRTAGDIYRRVGLGKDASILYERALVYRPDDPAALAGLGIALAAEGRAARGASVLAHAIELAEARGDPTAWMLLELGRILGERLGDAPSAIARLRDVPEDATEALEARGLEGRLRAEMGDASGASLAYARMRERAGRMTSAVPWLDEAARFEQTRGDLHAAQRHLATAIGISPGSDERTARYRALGELIAERAGLRINNVPTGFESHVEALTQSLANPGSENSTETDSPEPITENARQAAPESSREAITEGARRAAPESSREAITESVQEAAPESGETESTTGTRDIATSSPDASVSGNRAPFNFLADDDEVGAGADDPVAEARIESLTRTLQGDPTDDAVVDELVALLSRLGRSMDLLALLSARLEDAPPERRAALLPKHHEVLATLENEARAAGRSAEADLFKMAREMG